MSHERGTIDLLTPEDVDSGEWLEDPEFSQEFAPVIMLFMEVNDIAVEPTLKLEKQYEAGEQGLLPMRLDKWTVHLNWSTHWQGKIPPHHYGVEFGGIEVGILSPYAFARTCWQCGLGSPRVGGTWRMSRMYVRSVFPKAPRMLPWCLPAHRCRGPLTPQGLINTCHAIDWWARTVPREMLQRDCAEELATRMNRDRYASDLLGKDDFEKTKLARPINQAATMVAGV